MIWVRFHPSLLQAAHACTELLSGGEALTRDDPYGDVHVVDPLGEGGSNHPHADKQPACHHHQPMSEAVAQDCGEWSCEGKEQNETFDLPFLCRFSLLFLPTRFELELPTRFELELTSWGDVRTWGVSYNGYWSGQRLFQRLFRFKVQRASPGGSRVKSQLLKKLRLEDCKFKAVLGKNLKRRLRLQLMGGASATTSQTLGSIPSTLMKK